METPDRLAAIFQHQRALTERFHPTEVENRRHYGGFDPLIPVDLLTFAGQETVRAHAWRVIEEVGEALHSMHEDQFETYMEEVADVFHFVVELLIISGVEMVDLDDLSEALISNEDRLSRCFQYEKSLLDPDEAWLGFVRSICDAVHELKWKAWKKNPVASNLKQFRWKLNDAFRQFIKAVQVGGMDANDLHAQYFAKAKVNHERIDAAR